MLLLDFARSFHAICYPGSISFESSGFKFSFKRGQLLRNQWLGLGYSTPEKQKLINKQRIRAIPLLEQIWQEEVQDFALGPVSGDLAEVEAFCRIQRLADQLHSCVMDSLRSLETSGDDGSLLSSSLEEKVVAGLAYIGATLHQIRLEIFSSGASEDSQRIPRLARFRAKLRNCCKSLHTSMQSLIAPEGDKNLKAYRVLHRLNNLSLDAGFARPDEAPNHSYIPNFGSVSLSSVKGGEEEEAEFWRSGQLSEEGLEWLLGNKFKTIVDVRSEPAENELAESALEKAELSGRLKRVRIPVKLEKAPTMEQVQEFARIVADPANKPVLLQSHAGVVRPAAMISRWREFVLRGGLECDEKEECSVEELLDDESFTALQSSPEYNNGEEKMSLSPFQAQVLRVRDVFSRKEMAGFFKKKRASLTRLQQMKLEKARSSSVITKDKLTVTPSSSGSENSTNGRLRGDVEDDLEGNMCVSKTGVVRLQSRRKAEMYLVRTDGFSCTRERVTESTLAFTHPSTQQQMLMWKTPPKTVLVLKKLGDELMEEAKLVASFLYHQEGMNVMVEPEVHDRFARYPGFGYIQTFYNHDIGELHERVDFVVCLGGDGVILHASNLFRNAVPPVVSFNLGSLGFLTAHPFEDYQKDLRAIIRGNQRIEGVYVTLRMRLQCEILRDGQPVPGKVFEVLNEVVVDRGSNPYLCKIECYERNRLITKVQADGVLVATPTGSTAYSTSAGGSMVHPNVPCMLFTPICPHSLSFRPVILPDSAILELKVPSDSRSNAWVSFDGKKRQQLSKGDLVSIRMSSNPLPTVNKSDQTSDWFRSLDRCFNWSARKEQMSLSH